MFQDNVLLSSSLDILTVEDGDYYFALKCQNSIAQCCNIIFQKNGILSSYAPLDHPNFGIEQYNQWRITGTSYVPFGNVFVYIWFQFQYITWLAAVVLSNLDFVPYLFFLMITQPGQNMYDECVTYSCFFRNILCAVLVFIVAVFIGLIKGMGLYEREDST